MANQVMAQMMVGINFQVTYQGVVSSHFFVCDSDDPDHSMFLRYFEQEIPIEWKDAPACGGKTHRIRGISKGWEISAPERVCPICHKAFNGAWGTECIAYLE